MTFEEVYNEYLIYASKRHKKQGFETLHQNFSKHVLPFFKETKIQDLSIQDIIAWQNNIIDENFSNNYNKNLYVCFNSFLKFCVLSSYIATNYLVLLGSFKKKVEYKKYQTYSFLEFYSFRKGLKNKIYRYFFDLLYSYGLRCGECMALKFSDLQGNVLHVGSSIQRGGKRELDSPKTSNSDRYIKINFIMSFELFILKCLYIKKYGDNDFNYFIFGGKKPLAPTTVKRYKHKACIDRKLKEIKIHEFRHSCATRLIRKGVPMKKVSDLLGHSSISITMDIYVHNKKEVHNTSSLKIDFFETLHQNFKKTFQSIITHFV